MSLTPAQAVDAANEVFGRSVLRLRPQAYSESKRRTA